MFSFQVLLTGLQTLPLQLTGRPSRLVVGQPKPPLKTAGGIKQRSSLDEKPVDTISLLLVLYSFAGCVSYAFFLHFNAIVFMPPPTIRNPYVVIRDRIHTTKKILNSLFDAFPS